MNSEKKILETFLKEESSEELRSYLDDLINDITTEQVSYKDIADIIIDYYNDDKDCKYSMLGDTVYYELTTNLEGVLFDELWNKLDEITEEK